MNYTVVGLVVILVITVTQYMVVRKQFAAYKAQNLVAETERYRGYSKKTSKFGRSNITANWDSILIHFVPSIFSLKLFIENQKSLIYSVYTVVPYKCRLQHVSFEFDAEKIKKAVHFAKKRSQFRVSCITLNFKTSKIFEIFITFFFSSNCRSNLVQNLKDQVEPLKSQFETCKSERQKEAASTKKQVTDLEAQKNQLAADLVSKFDFNVSSIPNYLECFKWVE